MTIRIAAVVHNEVKHDVRLFGLSADSDDRFVLPSNIPVYLGHRNLSEIKDRIQFEGLE